MMKQIFFYFFLCFFAASQGARAEEPKAFSPDELDLVYRKVISRSMEETITELSNPNGYFHHPEIQLDFSPSVKPLVDLSNQIGLKGEAEYFQRAMNRVAERGAPVVRELIKNKLEHLSHEKSSQLFMTKEKSITQDFKEKFYADIREKFQPEIRRLLSEEPAIRTYRDLAQLYESLPYLSERFDFFSLDRYIADQALEGAFYLMEKKEQEIFQRPGSSKLGEAEEILEKIKKE